MYHAYGVVRLRRVMLNLSYVITEWSKWGCVKLGTEVGMKHYRMMGVSIRAL